jgi:3-hydroxyacyl-[acyl-carrier-protein] dehydratase
MRFTLIDRIIELKPNESITAVKALTMAEEYLADHFPLFPVMPGVLMLEAMYEASAWLVRASEDFAHSMVVLKEARAVSYKEFVAPGQLLAVTAEIVKQDEQTTRLKARGMVDGRDAVGGRLTLERYNLADRHSSRTVTDGVVISELRKTFDLLYCSSASMEPAVRPG